MIVCATDHVDQTKALAAAVAGLVRDGDVVVLQGDLGAGKTHFTQGFARALGVEEPVTSPTFTLANRYRGTVVVNHLDAYRLDGLAEAEDLALPELFDDGVTLIEWGDTILPALPVDRLDIRILLGAGDDDRVLEIVGVGHSWTVRADQLARVLAPWEQPC